MNVRVYFQVTILTRPFRTRTRDSMFVGRSVCRSIGRSVSHTLVSRRLWMILAPLPLPKFGITLFIAASRLLPTHTRFWQPCVHPCLTDLFEVLCCRSWPLFFNFLFLLYSLNTLSCCARFFHYFPPFIWFSINLF